MRSSEAEPRREEFEDSHLFDFALNYQLPVWQDLGPWLKFELINIFNNTPRIGFNTTVTPDPDSLLDALGLPTGFIRESRFGEATENAHFPVPRTFRMGVGFRF